MSMRKQHLGRSRAFRPSAESLEGRQLLSATVSGTDTAGDQWTLTLQGQGTHPGGQADRPDHRPARARWTRRPRSTRSPSRGPTRSSTQADRHGQARRRQRRAGLLQGPDRAVQRFAQDRDRPGDALDQHARLLAGRTPARRSRPPRPSPWPRSTSPTASTRSASAASTPPSSSAPTPPTARRRTARTTTFLVKLGCPIDKGHEHRRQRRSSPTARPPPRPRRARRPRRPRKA